jgi:Family of unknown function (DUF6496)
MSRGKKRARIIAGVVRRDRSAEWGELSKNRVEGGGRLLLLRRSQRADLDADGRSKVLALRNFLKESAFLRIERRREKMARYSKSASGDVKRAMERRKARTLKSGKSGKTVKSKKQAIAIGLSEARAKGKKVPSKKSA